MCQYDEPERGLTILSSRLVAALPSCPCGLDKVPQGSPSAPNSEAPPFLLQLKGTLLLEATCCHLVLCMAPVERDSLP